MANTKKLERAARKVAKRKARRKLKALYDSMNLSERKKFKEAQEAKIRPGLKKFLKEFRAKASAE